MIRVVRTIVVVTGLVILASCTSRGSTVQPAAPASGGAVVTSPPAPLPAPVATSPCPGGVAPRDPLEYARCRLALAQARAQSASKVVVTLVGNAAAQGVDVAEKPESFTIVQQGETTTVVGRDAVGAMYGALDIADRLDESGASALPLSAPVKQAPAIALRAANLVLPLPEAGHPWVFRDPEFWTEYLDLMARSRFDMLDIHALYDLTNSYFANVLLYVANSPTYPNIGLPRSERDANLAMLNYVIDQATVRGIKVGLMTYRADVSPKDPRGNESKETPEEQAAAPIYTREAVADLATRAPGLSYLGFRVGESNRNPDWYISTFIAGLRQAHSRAVPYTRTWLTTKQALTPIIAAGGPETIVEAKFNGEQLGSPYQISGGNMEHWKTYSYEDFLTPPTPYKFVYQVLASGTHRMFRYASYERTRRTVLSMLMSPRVTGFSLQPTHSYLPPRDFYHRDPADSFSPYAFRRDELTYLLFGRLGYDPTTPEHVFRAMLRERVGTDALWEPVQAASEVVPWAIQAHTCGPDQRNYAPELELGGPVGYWASPKKTPGPKHSCHKTHETFDEFAIALPAEAASDLLEGKGTSRVSPVEIGLEVLADAKKARAAQQVAIDPSNAEARDVVRECVALADLGDWLGHKLRGATALAVYEGSGSKGWLDVARSETEESDSAYTALARDTQYILPFEEQMRMRYLGLLDFHWEKNLPRLAEDAESIDAAVEQVKATHPHARGPLPKPKAWLDTPRSEGPRLVDLKVTPNDPAAPKWVVTATLGTAVPLGTAVKIIHRPFESNGHDWKEVEAIGSGTTWRAEVPGTHAGGMFAVVVNEGPGQAWRYPDVLHTTPYVVLAP